jgi:hypothetical protein
MRELADKIMEISGMEALSSRYRPMSPGSVDPTSPKHASKSVGSRWFTSLKGCGQQSIISGTTCRE